MLDAYEQLFNRGVYVLREALPAPEARTLVVCGVARSGTTMLVRVLHALGIFMGDPQLWRRNCEAPELYVPLEAGDQAAFCRQLRDFEQAHGTFGFKRPEAYRHFETIEACVRQPHYIVSFRDMLAIANRNRLSMDMDLLGNLRDTWERYGVLLNMIERSRAPTLLVSYEKALQAPLALAEQLAAWAGRAASAEQLAEAVRACQPNDPRYVLPMACHA